MKTKFEITAARNVGFTLEITGRARIGKASYSPYRDMTIYVPNTDANLSAYRIGRVVTLHVAPARGKGGAS